MLIKDKKWRNQIILGIYAFLCYFQIFHHLDFFPLVGWDESLFGMRMLSIAEDGAFLRNFDSFQGMGHPNHKPPFITLIQVFFYQLMGDSQVELALRLPSAIGTFAFLVYLPYFSQKKLGTFSWGILAGLVLLCSRGYNALHIAKTGDHDAPLAIIMIFGLFCFYQYMEAKNAKEQNIFLALLSLSFLLGYLTKSVMAFFFVFGFIAYALAKGRLLEILKQPGVYIAAAILAVCIVCYHLILNKVASPYHTQMHVQGLSQFVNMHPSQTHDHPWDYYFYRLLGRQFYPFMYVIPIGISVAFNKHFPKLRDISLLSFFSVMSYFLIISISVTKLEWYDAALYPPLAMLAASGIYMIWRASESFLARSEYFSPSLKYIALFLLFAFPYYWINSQFHVYKLLYPGEKFAYIMDQVNRKSQIKNYYISAPLGNPHASFYAAYYNKNKNYQIVLTDSSSGFQIGDHVMLCDDEFIAEVEKRYEVELVDLYDQCRFFVIKGISSPKPRKEQEVNTTE